MKLSQMTMTDEEKLKERLQKAVTVLAERKGDTGEIKWLKAAMFDAGLSATVQSNKDNRAEEVSHNPIAAKNILATFSGHEVLKFITHDYDSAQGEFDYEKFTESANTAFRDLIVANIKDLHMKTFDRLNGFVRGLYFYTYPIPLKIEMAWGNKALADWCKSRPGVYPSQYPLPDEIKNSLKENWNVNYPYFSDVIKRFKFDIQLRTEDRWQTLDKIIKNCFTNIGLNTDFRLDIEDTELFRSIDTFIDTVLLKEGICALFKWINLHKDRSTIISVTLHEKSDMYELAIKHVGSHVSWDVYAQKRDGLLGDTKTIRQKLRNVCDWQMYVSTTRGERFMFPYLTCNQAIDKPVQPVHIQNWAGGKDVTYILKLYK